MPERWMTVRVYGNILYTTGAWGIEGSGAVDGEMQGPDVRSDSSF